MDIWRFEQAVKQVDRASFDLPMGFEQKLHDKIMKTVQESSQTQTLEKRLSRFPRMKGFVAGFVALASAAIFGWLQWAKIPQDEKLAMALAKDPEAYRGSLLDSSEVDSWIDTDDQRKLENLNETELQELMRELQ